MKALKYTIIFLLSMNLFSSCLVSDETSFDDNDTGNNVVTTTRNSINLTAIANGDEYRMEIPINITGPTVTDLTDDVTVQISSLSTSTALANTHYKIENPTITLKKSNNYRDNIIVTLLTDGNAPPKENTPEYEAYSSPFINLQITASGVTNVVGTGKGIKVTINFIAPNPYAGLYNAHLIYRHPAYGTYPDNIYVDEVNEKVLAPITGRQCETWFGTWDTDICWITVNADNSITYVVDDTWEFAVALGDPFDSSKVSHFDPETGIIYLYYHYYGTDGRPRIFWEVFTPNF